MPGKTVSHKQGSILYENESSLRGPDRRQPQAQSPRREVRGEARGACERARNQVGVPIYVEEIMVLISGRFTNLTL